MSNTVVAASTAVASGESSGITERLRHGSHETQSNGVGPDAFVLGVDLDGVCGDYTDAFRNVVAAERGVSPESLGPQTNWDFTSWGITTRDEFLDLHAKAVLDYRIFATMNVIDGAAEALWELSEAGVWIRIITHRLHLKGGHSAAMADTVEWLDRNGIPFRDICFLGAKKDVGADMYVDDSPGNVETLRAAGGTTVVFSQPYNTHVGGLRADGWSDVVDLVSAAVSARG